MAEKHLDPEDPFSLTGHMIELTPGEAEEHLIEMTDTIIHEFSMMGWPPEMIFAMFKKPFYRMPHQILQKKGETFVASRISTIMGVTPESISVEK